MSPNRSDGVIYLRCVIHQKVKCKGSAKLHSESNTFDPLKHHNHLVSEILVLESKYVSAARSSRERLSKVFKDVVRNDPSAVHMSYKTLESAMYRAKEEKLSYLFLKVLLNFVNLLYYLIWYTVFIRIVAGAIIYFGQGWVQVNCT